MVSGILGKKIGMAQLFDDKGDVHPITVLQAGPCVVTQRKSAGKDGYESAQLGLVEFVKSTRVNKAMAGHFSKHNLPPVKFMREFPIIAGVAGAAAADEDKSEAQAAETQAADGEGKKEQGKKDQSQVKVGDKVLVDIFEGDRFVDVVGTSKGRGFAGVVKRHHFRGGAASHGSMFQMSGSIGSSAFPSRVFKGMRMAGHMGTDRVTVRNLRIVGIDLDENLLMVEGAVPGPKDGYLLISKAKKPPRERRGFAGAGTLDPLKAAKKASAGKKK